MFEESLEERPIFTSAISPEEPAVKALGVRGVRGKRKGMKGGPMRRCDAQRRGEDMREETNIIEKTSYFSVVCAVIADPVKLAILCAFPLCARPSSLCSVTISVNHIRSTHSSSRSPRCFTLQTYLAHLLHLNWPLISLNYPNVFSFFIPWSLCLSTPVSYSHDHPERDIDTVTYRIPLMLRRATEASCD